MGKVKSVKRPENLELFKELIKKSGYKPYIISEKLGHNNATMYAWIKGRYEPSAKDMLGLVKILQVPAETILKIFGEEI